MIARVALPLAVLVPLTALAVPLPQPRPAELKAGAERKADRPTSPETDDAAGVTPAPVPQPRPPDLDRASPEPEEAEAEVPLDPIPDALCDALEASGEAEFERLPRIIEGDCGGLTPIRLKALTPKDGQRVTLETPVTINCTIAKSLLDWLKTSVQPLAAKHFSEPVEMFVHTNGYQCRSRNRVNGAKLSEHGKANAVDIGGFKTTSGKLIEVGNPEETGVEFLGEIRTSACGPFTTVLGPGSDPYHSEHLHLDNAVRGKNGRATYCR